ncbi:MobA-like NTP transferase protein [Rhodothalassium salexigens DSM 2132]|uniref:MobA-like NTP transferase protein n=1 Tax=Rhodothalassium salexigens DSM 2132 TaxID=1188247 RepID=A0A4R2PUE0_RHOSA|nr:NTP transferase domain-containing protein [Rhodothalassium salexigens]MBB4210689.1 CTP:molybdopterin cytidylyltransferase MocA [Rhodothalassium salexigens DSM 2132]MBK1637890.1 hypothetical protein [Rhodothalassium salexigens DSM 2132]TCP37755.1 MobA-like NTP transferase protein [Rhodothalassium salexigens DSM 2132]
MASSGQVTALVMAASRRGPKDSVAALCGVSHKCLAPIAGRVMIERVVETLIASQRVGRVFVSIEDGALLRGVPALARLMDQGRLVAATSRGNLADSVLAGVEAIEAAGADAFPLLITTGDNALHTPAVVRDFADALLASERDITVGVAPEAAVARDHPGAPIAYHRFRDISVSGCNLYGLRTERALKAVRVFEGGGQFGKRHKRILDAFGVMPFILYKTRWATAQGLFDRIGRNLGPTLEPTYLDYGFAPIDVDNPASYNLSAEILAARADAAPPAAADPSTDPPAGLASA